MFGRPDRAGSPAKRVCSADTGDLLGGDAALGGEPRGGQPKHTRAGKGSCRSWRKLSLDGFPVRA
jgi:hypothetical protein